MAIQIIPGADEYLSRGIKSLGETISMFTETDRLTQKAIKNMLIEKPELVQQFADLEHRTPGSLKKMGFGKVADMVSQVGPSIELLREERFGERELNIEDRMLGFREWKANAIAAEIARDPTISALQMDALLSHEMGIPTQNKLKIDDLAILPLEQQNQRALLVMQAVERGENVDGAVLDFVKLFRNGNDDPETTGAIMAHPLLGPQFEALWEYQNFQENAALQRDLTNARITAAQSGSSGMSAAIQREVAMITDLRQTSAQIRRYLTERPNSVGLKFVFPEIVNARSDPDGVRLRMEVASLSSTLFHLRSGTAVTANEKTRLEPLTPNRWDTADAIYKKLDGLERFFDDFVRTRQNMGNLNTSTSSSTSISAPSEIIEQMIRTWLLEDPTLTNIEIQQKVRDFNSSRGGR